MIDETTYTLRNDSLGGRIIYVTVPTGQPLHPSYAAGGWVVIASQPGSGSREFPIVTSINGETGDVTLPLADGVSSVDGQKGDVNLSGIYAAWNSDHTGLVIDGDPVPTGGAGVTHVDAGSPGAAYSLAMSTAATKWVTAQLTADLTVTLTAFPAGSCAVLKLTQDSTPRTLAISDGTTTVPVNVPATAGTFFEVGLSSADGVNIDVELLGVPGAQGQVGQTGLQGNPGPTGPAGPSGASPNAPSVGEETFDRLWCSTTASMTSQMLRLSYFTARTTETITKILLTTAGSGAGATPTLIRAGVWSVDASDNLTALLASTANDTTLLTPGSTEFLKAFSASFSKVAGTRYAVGLLVVTAATVPTIPAAALSTAPLSGATQNRRRIAAAVSGQADLPSTATVSASNNATVAPYFELVP